MKLSKIITSSVISIGVLIFVTYFAFEANFIDLKNNQSNEKVELIEWKTGKLFNILVDPNDLIIVEGKTIPLKATFGLKKELKQTYNEISVFDDGKSIFIIPTFTASAYSKNGFYDFYNRYCDKRCLTTEIVSVDKLDLNSSANAVKILQLLGYDSILDTELNKNPNILKNYDKVIVLHNEYVTKKQFDAITSHPNVIYLYPNALYAEISVDDKQNTISLIKGHGYPEKTIDNGFGWKFDNTRPYEFDKTCDSWEFYPISNGFMLNCYPEQIIWKNELLLKTIKEL